MAYKGSIVIPTQDEHAINVADQISASLAREFGGYSSYDGYGGWIDDDGNNVEEWHMRVVVLSEDSDRLEQILTDKAKYVKDELDEEAVLIEIQETDMKLV